MTATQIMDEATKTGRVWLGGEMEISVNEGPQVALSQAAQIASACGYLASWKYGRSAISISGGDIPGEVVLDWFRPDGLKLVKASLWREESAYAEPVS